MASYWWFGIFLLFCLNTSIFLTRRRESSDQLYNRQANLVLNLSFIKFELKIFHCQMKKNITRP